MNFSQLEAFVETCRLGSYTKAAERLYISQPALHHKVKQLESDLGVPLLVVRDRQVVATAEGRLLLDSADRILGEVHALEEHFQLVAAEQTVRVGATSLLAAIALSEAVAEFHAERPSVNVHVISLDPDELYDTLAGNRVDFAVSYKDYISPDLDSEPLIESQVICVAAPDHPLVDGKVHGPLELLRYPLALTMKGMGMRAKIERWFAEVGGVTQLSVSFEARTGALLAQVAASANGFITFLPERALQQFRLERVYVDGPRIPSIGMICYLHGQRHRPVVAQFLGALRAVTARSRDTDRAEAYTSTSAAV